VRSRKHTGPNVTDQVSHSHAQKFPCGHPDSTDINTSSDDQGCSGEYRGRVLRLLPPLTVVPLGHLTIDKLSDDVLLRIFDSHRREDEDENGTWRWQVLVHICKRWRRIIFAYPGRLDLQLVCRSKADVKTALDIWPALPISIQASFYGNCADGDDVIGTLEDRDRIVGIDFGGLTRSKLEKCVALMQQSFPVLSSLRLFADKGNTYVIPDAFLGGSAPRLERVSWARIRFPALPKLLSSARDLVDLHLGFFSFEDISLEAMVTCLSVLTRLRSLNIDFKEKVSSPDPTSQSPTSLTPTVLPALTNFSLGGPSEYLEKLLTQIATPLLEDGDLQFYDAPRFDTPGVSQFIHRTGMFKLPSEVDVYIRKSVLFALSSSIGPKKKYAMAFSGSDFNLYTEVKLMEQICTQYPPLLSHIERLCLSGVDVEYRYWPLSAPWLGFLRPFTAVQTLHLSGSLIMPRVSDTLGKLAEKRAAEVLPALHTLVLDLPREAVSEAARLVEPFIVARKYSEHPVVLKRSPDSASSDAE